VPPQFQQTPVMQQAPEPSFLQHASAKDAKRAKKEAKRNAAAQQSGASGARARSGSAKVIVIAVVLSLIAGGAAGAATAILLNEDNANTQASSSPITTQPPSSSTPSLGTGGADVSTILESVQPAVVSIRAVGGGGSGDGAGSGMIISTDGEILTNAHVIEGAVRIEVTLDGERDSIEAELVGSEPSADVALLRLVEAPDSLPIVSIGSSGAVSVGDEVVAIGNALALPGGPTVTTGIISGKDRTLRDAGIVLGGLIQTDAAINPGNSGGPLVNSLGDVIGMNTAVIQSAGGAAVAQNIGFAIASDTFVPIIEDLRTGGGVRSRAYLGVESQDVTEQLASRLGLKANEGAIIAAVESGTAADEAGLQRFDVVLKVDDDDINSAAELVANIGSRSPGDQVTLTIERDGETIEVEVTLGSRP